jgi:methyl-accepting chemotaxis protein
MKKSVTRESGKPQVSSVVWNIRRKLIAGFSTLILVAVASQFAIWSQLQSVTKLTGELGSLNPIAQDFQNLANDVNAYLLGNGQDRQEFRRHTENFNQNWQQFYVHQANHQSALPQESVQIIKIQNLSKAFVDGSWELFDSYDKQLLTQARFNRNVNKIVEALNELLDADAEYKREVEVNRRFEKLRLDVHSLIAAVQEYRLGNDGKEEAIKLLVTEFEKSMGFFLEYLTRESDLTDINRSQSEFIKTDWLKISGDSFKLINVQKLINKQWQAVVNDGDALVDLVTGLIDTHNKEIESTRKKSTRTAILVIFIVILIGIGAFIFIDRMISTPITRLFIAVHEFGQGDRDQRVEVRSNDEIGELGEAFNQMADDITEYETEISGYRTELEIIK